MRNIKLNFKNERIIITKSFAKAAEKYGSEAYKELMAAKQDNPTFKVEVKKTKPNKKEDNMKGLTYEYMENYIREHDDEEGTIMKEFLTLTARSEEAKKLNMKPESYQKVKTWFFDVYPEIAEFDNKRNAILDRVAAASGNTVGLSFLIPEREIAIA